MNIFRKVLRKLLFYAMDKPLTLEQNSEKIKAQIIQGGGKVGTNVDIYDSSIDLGEPYFICIGNNVTITGVKILTHDASLKKTVGYTKTGKVVIGNDVFVGWGSIILPNTTIGSRVVIGAGSVIAKDIPDNSVVVGSGKIVCTYDEYVEKIKKDMQNKPVLDLYPDDILKDEESIKKLITNGNGYML